MEILHVVLFLIAAVLLSSIFDQFFTRLSLPLVQMAMGIALAVVIPYDVDATIDSELFLVLFIAPLLFDESKRVSKKQLLNHMSGILSLAIALVVAAMFAVGFLTHVIEPSIPLAAALALGAALGPTDAVAVTSLASTLKLSKRQKALLSGEALINDASGIVTFQFAVAAVVTGTFSLADAGTTFARTFFGGLVIGIIFALLARTLMSFVHKIDLDSPTFHVVFDLMVPFAAFLIGESLHVSGIIAVVAAGLALTWLPERGSGVNSEALSLADGVWETVSFVLNGIVFVMLGVQLPAIILPHWQGTGSIGVLTVLIFSVTAVVILVRFVWLFFMELWNRASVRREGSAKGEDVVLPRTGLMLRDVLVTTLAGPKGAVTLSIIFTLPYVTQSGESFPHRADLIFIASGVIVLTLLLANFVIPLLAEDADSEDDDMAKARALVYCHVIDRLYEQESDREDLATAVITRDYETRLADLDAELANLDRSDRSIRVLRREMLEHQRKFVERLVVTGQIDPATARHCIAELRYSYGRSLHKKVTQESGRISPFTHGESSLKTALSTAFTFARRRVQLRPMDDLLSEERLQDLRGRMWRDTSDFLRDIVEKNADNSERARAARTLLEERAATLALLKELGTDTSVSRMTALQAPDMSALKARRYEVEMGALRLEREAIDRLWVRGLIDREQSLALREEVYEREVALNSAAVRN